MKLEGRVSIYLNGQLVLEDSNNIETGIRSYFETLMSTPSDQAIDSLFTTDGEIGGGTEDGNDGILVAIDGTYNTMITTDLGSPTQTSHKWKGEYTNTSGGVETLNAFSIGYFFSGSFSTQYASYDPADFDIQDQDTVIIEWEIKIS